MNTMKEKMQAKKRGKVRKIKNKMACKKNKMRRKMGGRDMMA